MNKPLVSIVITSFNRLEELKETVKRTGDISYSNLEIIVVDGGSKDGSVDFLNSLDQKKYKTIILGIDKGSAFSHNQGMKTAKGEFVITIDDDCFLSPWVVEKTIDIFLSNPKLAAIGYGLENPNISFNDKIYWSPINLLVKNNQYDSCYDTNIYASAAAWRKSVLEEIGYIGSSWFFSNYSFDTELNVKLISYGYNSVIIPELIAFHKISPSHRNAGILTTNGIHGTILIILKYYPFGTLLLKLIKIFYLCIYFSILNKNFQYLKALLLSIENAHKMLNNKKRLPYSISKKIILPDICLFNMSNDIIWSGS